MFLARGCDLLLPTKITHCHSRSTQEYSKEKLTKNTLEEKYGISQPTFEALISTYTHTQAEAIYSDIIIVIT